MGIVAITAGVATLTLLRVATFMACTHDLVFPVLAALTYASGNVVRGFKFTVSEINPETAVTVAELALVMIVGGYALVRYGSSPSAVLRKTYGYFTLGGVCSSLGLLSLFVALNYGPAIIVDPLDETSPLFSLVIAYVLLRHVERITRGVNCWGSRHDALMSGIVNEPVVATFEAEFPIIVPIIILETTAASTK